MLKKVTRNFYTIPVLVRVSVLEKILKLLILSKNIHLTTGYLKSWNLQTKLKIFTKWVTVFRQFHHFSLPRDSRIGIIWCQIRKNWARMCHTTGILTLHWPFSCTLPVLTHRMEMKQFNALLEWGQWNVPQC
jgi:hypothetical protein